MSAVLDPLSHYPLDEPSAPRSLWRNVDFLLLWWGQVVSLLGTQLSQLAFPLLVLAVTRSPAETGIITALRGIPYIILTLPAGAIADRWNRKHLMIACDAGRAVALGSIPVALVTGHLTVVQLAVASIVEGTLFTFFNVAESASIPQVVHESHLPQALSISFLTDNVGSLVGPTLGGALYGIGRSVPFLVDAVSYAVSVVSLLFIKTEFQEERTPPTESLWREIHEGVVWLWRQPLLRALALLAGGLNLFSMGYPLIMIVRAQEFHASPFVIGLLFATGGIGGILGAAVAPWLQSRFTVGEIIIAGAWVWALTWLPYALAPNLFWFGVANAAGFVIIPIFTTTHFAYRMALIPDWLQGRGNSIFKLVAFGSQPIAMAFTGVLLQEVGAVTTIVVTLIPQVVLAGIAMVNSHIRHAPMLRDVVRLEG